jgi:hypothetical protein
MIKQTMKRRWFNLETRPVKLFGDKDRDGVANVFDCQPRNPRRQDKSIEDWKKELNKTAKQERKEFRRRIGTYQFEEDLDLK